MTVREAYQAAVDQLQTSGFDNAEARLSARLLLDDFVQEPYAHLTHPGKILWTAIIQSRFLTLSNV
jgi:hypothetical protein